MEDSAKEKNWGSTMVARYIPTLMAIGAVLAGYRILSTKNIMEAFGPHQLMEQYDYIIVGAGTSGSVLASRLTEDEDRTVLLLEAGSDPSDNPDVDIPIFADSAIATELDWQYTTVPQRSACKGHVDNVAKWPSGKCVGGTSNINYMMYLRGSRHDYDEWAKNGAQGWAYKDVLPYFIKSEDNRNNDYVRTDDANVFHGFGGRLTVSDIEVSRATQIMTDAFKELGVKRRDINGRSQYGYSHTQATIYHGERWSTNKAFLSRAMHRDNFHLLTESTVIKILFEGKRAVGVQYMHEGALHEVRATKDVILTSGTVGSAKLLLLSGVGPRNHLQSMKIPVVADLPVGDNLQDHVVADGAIFYTEHGVSVSPARAENFLSSWAYSIYGGGMKQSPRFREGTAYVRIRQQPAHIKYPLIMLQVVANIGVYDADFFNVKPEVWKAIHGKPPTRDGIIIYPVLLHPRSKGTIRLKSANFEDDPLINPNYLAEDADVKVLAEGLHYARRLANTKAFRSWDLKLNNHLLPECASLGNFTNNYVECFLRHITIPGRAPVGSCKMGAAGDPTAVVDPLLRVRGIKGLRVIDASIIPSAMSGDTYATQIMIAEKASDIIRDKDTVQPIKEYFKHLIAVRHEKFKDEEEVPTQGSADKATDRKTEPK